jgi:hypothetical protein
LFMANAWEGKVGGEETGGWGRGGRLDKRRSLRDLRSGNVRGRERWGSFVANIANLMAEMAWK